MAKKINTNPIVKNIRSKYGWSLTEYCLRRNIETHNAKHVIYEGVGKQLRGDKSTQIIKILSEDGVYVR